MQNSTKCSIDYKETLTKVTKTKAVNLNVNLNQDIQPSTPSSKAGLRSWW